MARGPLRRPCRRRLLSPSRAAPLLVAVFGALGAVLRWSVGETWLVQTGFPWSTFAINVAGTALLASLPAVPAVRRRPALAAGLGSGLCGGFTTLSAYSEQTRALLADGHAGTAGLYAAGTLLACLLAVHLVTHLTARP